MKLSSAFVNLSIIFVSVISFLVFLFGFFNLLINHENGRQCQMTYMFEYPDFTRIYVNDNLKYPQYKLYAYSEGIYTYKIQGLKFKGIPVLFIPGNGGSYKQVRSLASIALRKATGYKYHFNFFAVDLNEELSGLYGGVLNGQAEFVNHSIYRILQLYTTRPISERPKSVILIGHSMGGIVALKVMTNKRDSQNIDLIITLSTPHLRPAIVLDHNTENFYNDIKRAWLPRADYLLNKTVITIGSGFNDRLVNTHLTQSEYTSLHAITTGIPKVWLDTEHVVIVWCKQLIMTLIRSLFDLIDSNTRQLISDHSTRKEVFHHYLIHNSGVNLKYKEVYQHVIPVNGKGDWIEFTGMQATFNLADVASKNIKWIMIPVSKDLIDKSIVIQARNLEETNWIYYCSAMSISVSKQICDKMYHLSQYSEIVPSYFEKRREINVDLKTLYDKLPEITHLIAKIGSDSKSVKLDVDIFTPSLRIINVTVPPWYTFFDEAILHTTQQGAIKYKINLYNFDNIYNAMSLVIKSECNTSDYQIIATFRAPWASQITTGYFNVQNKKPIPVTVFSSKPHDLKNLNSYIELNLDSSCVSEIRIKSNIIESLGQITRHYSIMLIANIGAVLILILRYQLLEENCTLITNSSIIKATKPYYFIIIVQILTELLNSNSAHFTPTDMTVLRNENMNFLLVPVLLHLGGIGIVFVLSFGLWIGIVLGGSTIQKLALKVICKKMFGFVRISEWMLDCLQNFSFGIVCALMFLATTTAGCLTLVLATMFYFLKLVKMYEDYLESLVRLSVMKIARQVKSKLFSRKKINEENKTSKDETNHSSEIVVIDNDKEISLTEKFDKLQNGENKNISVVSRIEDLKVDCKNDSNTDLRIINDDCKDNTVNNETIIQQDQSIVLNKSRESEYSEETESGNTDENISKEVDIKQNSEKSESFFTPLSGLHFHFTTFLVFCLVSAISIPSVLTWARNYRYSTSLAEDPSFIPAVILFISAYYLWDIDVPKTNLKYKTFIGNILYAMAVITVIYSTLTVYRLSYFLSFAILLVALHQRFSPDEQIEDMTPSLDDNDYNQQVEKIKMEENEQKMMKAKFE